MQHRLDVLKANAFEAAVFFTVAAGSLGAALVVMTVLMPVNELSALLVGLPTAYWVSAGLFAMTDRAAVNLRGRLHRAAHCTDCSIANITGRPAKPGEKPNTTGIPSGPAPTTKSKV